MREGSTIVQKSCAARQQGTTEMAQSSRDSTQRSSNGTDQCVVSRSVKLHSLQRRGRMTIVAGSFRTRGVDSPWPSELSDHIANTRSLDGHPDLTPPLRLRPGVKRVRPRARSMSPRPAASLDVAAKLLGNQVSHSACLDIGRQHFVVLANIERGSSDPLMHGVFVDALELVV